MFIFYDRCMFLIDTENFMEILMCKWDEIYNTEGIFRYKINNVKERLINGKYLLQLNSDRGTKRRKPAQIDNMSLPFDKNKFNFTKVSHNEIMFKFKLIDRDDVNTVLVNVSPISKYHALLCPSLEKCLPQVVTIESLKLAINIMFKAKDRNLRIGFNSLCGLASVNHLHYHLFIEKHVLPVETVNCNHIKGPLYCFDETYPVPAFCFELPSYSTETIRDIFKVPEYLLEKSIAHNIFLTRGDAISNEHSKELLRVIIYPRKSSLVKEMGAFNVATLELSGWFTVYDAKDYENLQLVDIERELKKVKYDEFDELCKEIKSLY